MRRAEAVFLVALACAALVAGRAFAQGPADAGGGSQLVGPTFTLTADEVSYDRARDLYEAAGHVRVQHASGGTLNADWVAFNRTTQIGVATGHVRLVDRQDVVV